MQAYPGAIRRINTILWVVNPVIYVSTLVLSNNFIPHPFNLLFKPAERTGLITPTKHFLSEHLPQSAYISRPEIKAGLYLTGAIECGYNYGVNNTDYDQFKKCEYSVGLKTALQLVCEASIVMTGAPVPYRPQVCYAFGRGAAKLALDQYYNGEVQLAETGVTLIKELSARLAESLIFMPKLGDPLGYYVGGLLEGSVNVAIALHNTKSKNETTNQVIDNEVVGEIAALYDAQQLLIGCRSNIENVTDDDS